MRKPTALVILLLGLCAVTLGQERPTSPLNGTWKATFADTVLSGTVFLTLEVQTDGSVSGVYKASTGGFGKVEGRFDRETFSFVLTQSLEDCPGTYAGSITVKAEQATGSYVGETCLGKHGNGVVSMVRATQEEIAALESSAIVPLGNIYVQGNRYWVSKSDKYLVLLSAEQDKGYFVLHIAIQNDSSEFVTFDPKHIAVLDLADNGKILEYVAPDEIAKRIRRRAAWATFFTALGAGLEAAGRSQPTTSYSYGTVRAHDQYGNFA